MPVGDRQETPFETLCRLLSETGARITFSINCHSGIVGFLGPNERCGCWRCREERGESWDEATESEAEMRSRDARRRWNAAHGIGGAK